MIVRHMARAVLPENSRLNVLRLYSHEARNGCKISNYRYRDGVAYLPTNPAKLRQVATLLGEEIIDQRSRGAPLQDPFVPAPGFTLREHQKEPAAQLFNEVQKNCNAVLQAGCGLGKTVVLTTVAGKLGCKILVIVDMGSLLTQWQEAFSMVWGRACQIITRRSESFGDVCITTFQLLHVNPHLLKQIAREFGCLLLDEFHTTQSDTRREVLFRLDAQYRIGCTATPYKKGYSDEVLTDLVADVSVVMKDAQALKPFVTFVKTSARFWNNNPDDWGKIQSKLAKDEIRNAEIVDLMRCLLAQGRKILVIGITIQQCKMVAHRLGGGDRLVVYTGSTSLAQDRKLRSDLAAGRISAIFTVKKADKGLDLPDLDCLVLARPSNNEAFVTQISGRIVRAVPGKMEPVIFDLRDGGTLSERFAANRTRWYRKLGYRILEGDTCV